MGSLVCARPYCEEKETRIDGYCSIYCRDIHELQVEAEAILSDKKELQAENERLEGMHNHYLQVCNENDQLRAVLKRAAVPAIESEEEMTK